MHAMIASIFIFLFALEGIICPPVKPGVKSPEHPAANDTSATGLEYERYLHEIVSVLEEDPAFKKKLEDSDINYIKSGEIAKDLDLVHHNIRERLDEIKRIEVSRLKRLVQEQISTEKRNGKHIPLKHLNLANPHSFETADLSKLIKQATMDLDELDKRRKEEFKTYEMQKEHEKKEKLSHLNATDRASEEAHLKEMEKKHKDHPKLHHPMAKAQLEEVWEQGDHLNPEDFDAKTFFKLHDINGDDVLDPNEVEALFTKEIAKMYDPNNPEDDMHEAQEEINRMREHVFKEADLDGNHVLDQSEFESLTKREDFNKDEGWKGLDEDNAIYTDEDMAEYERMLKGSEEHHEPSYDHIAQPGQVNQPYDPNVVHMQQPGGADPQQYAHMQQQQQVQMDHHQQQQPEIHMQQQAQFAQQQQQQQQHPGIHAQPGLHQQPELHHEQQQDAHPQQPPVPPNHQPGAAAGNVPHNQQDAAHGGAAAPGGAAGAPAGHQ